MMPSLPLERGTASTGLQQPHFHSLHVGMLSDAKCSMLLRDYPKCGISRDMVPRNVFLRSVSCECECALPKGGTEREMPRCDSEFGFEHIVPSRDEI